LRIGGKTGGQLIDELMACVQEQGDEKLRQMYTDILNKTAVPFLAMISDWIFRGEIWDRSGEFMIQENTSFQRDALKDDFNARFWEGRYTLRRSQVPKIFRQHADKILAAGKYLNILRDCSIGAEESHELLPRRRQLFLGMDGSTELMRIIEDAHLCSSRLLLRILMDRHGLITHITSLRRFMLLEHGDFFVQFMDMAEVELRQEAQALTLPRVQTLLQGAVQSSSLVSDAHKDEFECILASHNLIQHLHLIQTAGAMGPSSSTFAIPANPLSSPPHGGDVAGSGPLVQGLKGVEALTLEYRVGWPVSIVLSRRAITKYQLLSRLLFFSKHVELRVLSCWRNHQNSKALSGIRKALGESLCLRHRMLHFLQNFVYYMTVEVIAPRSHQLMEDLEAAQDIDEVLMVHERFLDTCLKECLLASQDLLRILTKLTTTCLLFADQMEKFMASTADGVRRDPREASGAAARSASLHRKVQADVLLAEISHETYVRMIAKFSDAFDTQLAEFLDKLWNDSNRCFLLSFLYL
jgi:gamma-tubulin complex component 2